MAKIKSKNTRLEKDFKKKLRKLKLHYVTQYGLYGKPDIVFPEKHVAVFIDSCFWHKCPKHCRIPKSNVDYWMEKLKRNLKRDKEVTHHLKKMGWKVVRVWEHEIIKDSQKPLKIILRAYYEDRDSLL